MPVFVDVDIPTYNIDPAKIEAAVSSEPVRSWSLTRSATRSISGEVMRVAEKHDLWLVEDCCDALGATYDGRSVGTFGDIGTLSFYPAHHITMGEGGAVFTDKPRLKRRHRIDPRLGPRLLVRAGQGQHLRQAVLLQARRPARWATTTSTRTPICGYNLKITDMQAAVGVAQLGKLDGFIAARAAQLRPC